MKRTKKLLITLLSLILVASFLSTPVFAKNGSSFVMPEIITLSAPEQQQRRFDLNGAFDLWTLSNLYTPIVICTGDADDLTITLSLTSKNPSQIGSKEYLDFMLISAGVSLSAAIFDTQSKTTPYTITSTLNMDTPFAAIFLVAMITSTTDGVTFPLEFTITYNLTETAAVTP